MYIKGAEASLQRYRQNSYYNHECDASSYYIGFEQDADRAFLTYFSTHGQLHFYDGVSKLEA